MAVRRAIVLVSFFTTQCELLRYVTCYVTLRYVTIPDPPNLVFLSKSIPFPLQTESALCSSETHEDRRKQVNNHTT